MLIPRIFALVAALTLLSAPTFESRRIVVAPDTASQWPSPDAGLSVMTYNIRGLPWPVAADRSPAIAAVGQRLKLMRSRGIQPRIVLLQETFTDEAKRLALIAGYRHVALGPQESEDRQDSPLGSRFADAARWLKGERIGNLVDSGLMVLSDYPIVRQERYAFPAGACAGFDCPAFKGVLIAWIAVPGVGSVPDVDDRPSPVGSPRNCRRLSFRGPWEPANRG